jgi:hypothetical protein
MTHAPQKWSGWAAIVFRGCRFLSLPFIRRAVVEFEIDFEKATGLIEIIGISHAVIESDFETFPPNFNQLVYTDIDFIKE